MEHLVRVEVIGEPPIVSVVGYRDEQEVVFDGRRPALDGEGNPVVRTVRVPVTKDVVRPGIAFLDPDQTNIQVLVQAGLVRLAPAEVTPTVVDVPTETDPKVKKGA